MTPKELTRIILKSVKKEDAPEQILIEMVLEKWRTDILNEKKIEKKDQ